MENAAANYQNKCKVHSKLNGAECKQRGRSPHNSDEGARRTDGSEKDLHEKDSKTATCCAEGSEPRREERREDDDKGRDNRYSPQLRHVRGGKERPGSAEGRRQREGHRHVHDVYRSDILSLFTESERIVALSGGHSAGPVNDIACQVEEDDEVECYDEVVCGETRCDGCGGGASRFCCRDVVDGTADVARAQG